MVNYEFKEIDIYGSHDGGIAVASVNVRKGVILFQKEIQTERTMDCCHEDAAESDYNFLAFNPKMSIFGQYERRHRKGEQRKPKRNNLKTMPDHKIQRANRNLLRQLKTFCADEEYFYEALDLLNDSIFSFLFSSMEFHNEDLGMKACV